MGRRSVDAAVLVMLLVGALVWAACGDDGASGDSRGSDSEVVDVDAAKAAVADYSGKPSAFPVDEPLARPPAGSRFAFLQNSTPVAALLASILQPAAETMGVQLDVVKGGATATSQQEAVDSIISSRPRAVLLPAIEPATINAQLERLEQAEIPVTSHGIMQAKKFNVDAAIFGTETSELAGKLLADWVIARDGRRADVAFYPTPELSFSGYIRTGFEREFEALCAKCEVRYVTVPVATVGSTAPTLVVSDLQAHPDTTTAVFASMEAATGLPAALNSAGIEVATVGWAPPPAILQDIENGDATAGLGLDLAVMMWTQLDLAARLAAGQPPTEGEAAGIPPIQFLEQKDITFDASKGWTGYPDFAERFAKLWNGEARP